VWYRAGASKLIDGGWPSEKGERDGRWSVRVEWSP
jgi:hypothetical protein